MAVSGQTAFDLYSFFVSCAAVLKFFRRILLLDIHVADLGLFREFFGLKSYLLAIVQLLNVLFRDIANPIIFAVYRKRVESGCLSVYYIQSSSDFCRRASGQRPTAINPIAKKADSQQSNPYG